MMKKIIFAAILLSLAACNPGRDNNQEKVISSEGNAFASATVSSSLTEEKTSTELSQWKYQKIPGTPFAMNLPITTRMAPGNPWKYLVSGLYLIDASNRSEIENDMNEKNKKIQNAPGLVVRSSASNYSKDNAYFSFSITSLGNIGTDELLSSLSDKRPPELKSAKNFGRLTEWTNSDIKITDIGTLGGPYILNGAVLEHDSQLYIISLPDGDVGKDSRKYYDLALKSLRLAE